MVQVIWLKAGAVPPEREDHVAVKHLFVKGREIWTLTWLYTSKIDGARRGYGISETRSQEQALELAKQVATGRDITKIYFLL